MIGLYKTMIGRLRQLSEPRLRQQAGIEKSQTPVERDTLVQWVRVRGPGFDTRSGNILSFLLPLFQEGQLSVTGESMCTKYWLTA